MMRVTFTGTACALAILSLSPAVTSAQTPLNTGPPPVPPPASAAVPPAVTAPLPDSVVEDAAMQRDGFYPVMHRPSGGGQIQNIWNETNPDEGVHVAPLCDDCVYKVRVREFMTSTIILPETSRIAHVTLGDPNGFQAKVIGPNMLGLRPNGWGMDSNLTVLTEAGGVYPFYLRAESFNSDQVPDLVFRIVGEEVAPETAIPVPVMAPSPPVAVLPAGAPDDLPGLGREDVGPVESALRDLRREDSGEGDFIERVEFDPGRLHGFGDYTLWGDSSLAPEVVFRDERFTYLQYGDRWPGLDLPAAYIIVDGIDEPVNTRDQGRTYIIESVNPLISLKLGSRFLCIEYVGEAVS